MNQFNLNVIQSDGTRHLHEPRQELHRLGQRGGPHPYHQHAEGCQPQASVGPSCDRHSRDGDQARVRLPRQVRLLDLLPDEHRHRSSRQCARQGAQDRRERPSQRDLRVHGLAAARHPRRAHRVGRRRLRHLEQDPHWPHRVGPHQHHVVCCYHMQLKELITTKLIIYMLAFV